MHVSLISDESITELTQGTDFTVTDRVVTLAAATTLKIKIYRQTATKPLVGWADASVLKAADMTVQSTQLLHLAEETSDLAQDGGLSKDTTDNVWDAKFNKIKNLLDPTDPGDAVTLGYITKNQDSLLNQLKNTGATQNSAIVATGDTQNARLNATGDIQNKRITDTGNAYVSTMTTLKDTATTKANDASNSAELSKKWAMSTTSPDGAADSKSSKTWAEDARKSANNSAFAATASQNSATASATSSTNASNSANASKQSANASANSASASASSAYSASTSASNAKISETNAKTSEINAANSAKAALQSEENAKKWDLTQLPSVVDMFYPVGTVYMSADKTKTKADFPFMAYGIWEEVPANLCLQTGAASEAGTQRSAGLPNITGYRVAKWGGADDGKRSYYSGCFKQDRDTGMPPTTNASDWNGENGEIVGTGFGFDASLSNPIYGASNTVQPPAYIVRAWVRTA